MNQGFWRFPIIIISFTISVLIVLGFINYTIFNVKVGASINDKNIGRIPSIDDTIPKLIAQLKSANQVINTPTTSLTPNSTSNSSSSKISDISEANDLLSDNNDLSSPIIDLDGGDSASSVVVSTQANQTLCLQEARKCRDVTCAFKDFNFSCTNNVPKCSCGNDAKSFSIKLNVNIELITIAIIMVTLIINL